MQTLSAHLTWSHYCELLPIQSIYEINYYIYITERQNLSLRELRKRIKSKEYDRLDEIYTGPSPISLSDFNIENQYISSYVQRVINSFSNNG